MGQNFIKFPSLVRELLEATDIGNNDLVIEIGPGKGVITRELTEKAGEVWGIEKDADLYKELEIKFKNLEFKNLKTYNQDFLEFKLPKKPYKVFSNIPFSITSEIMNKFLTEVNMPDAMYLIMQLEVAEKFKGGVVETMSSVLTKPWYEVEILGEIDRTNFTLKPQVKIVFVKFVKRKIAYIKEEDKSIFRKFVSYGFSKWKPTVLEAFKEVMTYEQAKHIRKALDIGDIKPSELTFDKWLLMFKMWIKVASEEQKRIIKRG
ncbi:hypothetical protein KBC75_00625 [Candidatus Shapirobacteria bacterium]|nr:hypothetical protein [Candidatus Shapirobacteria bacterium]